MVRAGGFGNTKATLVALRGILRGEYSTMAKQADITPPLDLHLLAEAHAALSEAFECDFALWVRHESWLQVSPDGTANAACCDEGPGKLETLLEQTVAAGQPRSEETTEGPLVGIPLRHLFAVPLVAVRRFHRSAGAWPLKLAVQFHKEYTQRDELEQLRNETQAFLRQVTNDFEELTYLRGMADLLEVTDLSFDLSAMADAVLPRLMPLVEAAELLLLPAIDQGEREPPRVGAPAVSTGAGCFDPQVCRRLVERFQTRCERRPIVRNNFNETSDGSEFAGVDSFILVPISTGHSTLGWLLALNRTNDGNINIEELPWQVSYLEFGTHEATLLSSSASILATHSRNVQLFREREELLVCVVRALVSAVEAKDEYTRGHSERVALYGKRLAEELGVDEDHCQRIYLTGLLHDIGKIGVRDAVLRKQGPLTDEEFEEIKTHPDKGWAILHDLVPLNYVLPGVLHHHESINGAGYPDGLAGEAIPKDGRLLAVADAYDAMTSDRPYRKGMPQEKAEAILRAGAGKQWDADMVDAFFRAMPDILDIKRTYKPQEPVCRDKAEAICPV